MVAYSKNVDETALLRVLGLWSLSFGELRDLDAEHFFMGNPVWHKPFIKLEDDLYFWPILGLSHSYLLDIVEPVIQQNDA